MMLPIAPTRGTCARASCHGPNGTTIALPGCPTAASPRLWLGTSFIDRPRPSAASVVHSARRSHARTALQATSDLSGSMLETVASLALRSRLRSCEMVTAEVDCTVGGLLTGAVEAVRMRGKAWESPAGLRCRSIRADVGPCKISARELITKQVITIDRPPIGTAQVVFTARDFQSFLLHPLMKEASAQAVRGKPVAFGVGGGKTVIEPPTADSRGAIRFTGQHEGQVYQMTLVPGKEGRGPAVMATRGQGTSEGLSRELTAFFRDLTLDLEGAEFTFSDLSIERSRRTEGGGPALGVPLVVLDLTLHVKSFPPPNVRF